MRNFDLSKVIAVGVGVVFFSICLDMPAAVGQTSLSVQDVKSIVDNRVALTGRSVTVTGFLLMGDDYYYLAQGARRAPNELGPDGEEYRCNYTGSPMMLWFTDRYVETMQVRLPRLPYLSQGIRVTVTGVLEPRTPVIPEQDVDIMHLPPEYLANNSLGPLRHVVIVSVSNERCYGAGG
jgi:hypothetical protein